MSAEILQKLEDRIDSAIENIELLRMQVEELETKNARLHEENSALKEKYAAWERNLSVMLEKLDAIEAKDSSYSQEVVPA